MTGNVRDFRTGRAVEEAAAAEIAAAAEEAAEKAVTDLRVKGVLESLDHLASVVAKGETRIFWGVVPGDGGEPTTFTSQDVLRDGVRAIGLLDMMKTRLSVIMMAAQEGLGEDEELDE